MSGRKKTVGVLMLETNFPRLVGDIGNPEGFGFPLIYKQVAGATPKKVVLEQSTGLLAPFIEAAHDLVADGAELITTSCGFLALFQDELQAAIDVPVVSSALLMLADLEAQYGEGLVGILTISRSYLRDDILAKAGIGESVPIGTAERTEKFYPTIMENRDAIDRPAFEKDLREAAGVFVSLYPEMKALLLECTNMAPFADAIADETGRPVYSLNSLLEKSAA